MHTGQEAYAIMQLAAPAPSTKPDIDVFIENLPGNVYRRVRRPDGSYYFEYLSSGLFRQFGIDHERLLSERAIRFDWIHPDDRARMMADLELSAATLGLLDHRIRITGRDGRVYWARGIAKPSRRDDGMVVWDGIVIDVTREIEAEAALRVAKDEADRAHRIAVGIVSTLSSDLTPAVQDLARLLTEALGEGVSSSVRRALETCRSRVLAAMQRLEAGEASGSVDTAPQRALTNRQLEVLRLIAAGHSNKAIGQKLGISPGTAKLHVASILRALGVRNRRELGSMKLSQHI